MTYTCEFVCQYAVDVGVPEYSGITNGTCGNCNHYAPVERECAVCYPRGVPCEGECDGKREATHDVVVGRSMFYATPMPSRPHMPPPEVIERTKRMCHTCAVNERTEKEYGYADE